MYKEICLKKELLPKKYIESYNNAAKLHMIWFSFGTLTNLPRRVQNFFLEGESFLINFFIFVLNIFFGGGD